MSFMFAFLSLNEVRLNKKSMSIKLNNKILCALTFCESIKTIADEEHTEDRILLRLERQSFDADQLLCRQIEWSGYNKSVYFIFASDNASNKSLVL